MDCNPKHEANACWPMVVTPEGMSTLESPTQLRKAISSMRVTDCGRVTPVKSTQFLKALLPTAPVTVAGTVTCPL